jgi:hypothetical protein
MAAIGYSRVPAWVPPAEALAAAPLELDDAGASTVCAPATDGALSACAEGPVLDGDALDGEPVDWVSLDPGVSPVELAVEELELSPEPDASAPPLVWAEASLPALPVDDSPAVAVVLDADAALADA